MSQQHDDETSFVCSSDADTNEAGFNSPDKEERPNALMLLAQQAPSQSTTESEKTPMRRRPATTTTTRGRKQDSTSNGNEKKKVARTSSRSAPRHKQSYEERMDMDKAETIAGMKEAVKLQSGRIGLLTTQARAYMATIKKSDELNGKLLAEKESAITKCKEAALVVESQKEKNKELLNKLEEQKKKTERLVKSHEDKEKAWNKRKDSLEEEVRALYKAKTDAEAKLQVEIASDKEKTRLHECHVMDQRKQCKEDEFDHQMTLQHAKYNLGDSSNTKKLQTEWQIQQQKRGVRNKAVGNSTFAASGAAQKLHTQFTNNENLLQQLVQEEDPELTAVMMSLPSQQFRFQQQLPFQQPPFHQQQQYQQQPAFQQQQYQQQPPPFQQHQQQQQQQRPTFQQQQQQPPFQPPQSQQQYQRPPLQQMQQYQQQPAAYTSSTQQQYQTPQSVHPSYPTGSKFHIPDFQKRSQVVQRHVQQPLTQQQPATEEESSLYSSEEHGKDHGRQAFQEFVYEEDQEQQDEEDQHQQDGAAPYDGN
jgi:hypothetical protein